MKTFLIKNKKRITWLLLIVTLICIMAMRIFDAPLKNEVCTTGITCIELAKDLDKSIAIFDSWDTNATINVSLSLGFDFLFILVYSSFIALLMFNVTNNPKNQKQANTLGHFLIIAVFIAGFFDIVENIAIIKLLLGDLKQIWSSVAYYFAVMKFAIILICILYILTNWGFLLLKKSTKN